MGFNAPDAHAGAVRPDSVFNANTLPPNDDGSTGAIPLGFTVNFFGVNYSSVFVNNNGNVTFANPLVTFTPFDLTSTRTPIIAPFFADVDTRGAGSQPTRYGQSFGVGVVNGHPAFGANYINVGYYASHFDKLNSFQVVLIDRTDTGAGNFDIELNYDKIQWETGDASGGVNGFGGTSARVGFSNGTGAGGSFFELQGSAVNGAFLDSNPITGLIYNSLNSDVPGTLLFQRARWSHRANALDFRCQRRRGRQRHHQPAVYRHAFARQSGAHQRQLRHAKRDRHRAPKITPACRARSPSRPM